MHRLPTPIPLPFRDTPPKRHPLAFVGLLLALAAAPSPAETLLTGRVVGVTDGDTVRLLVDGQRLYKIRLGEIDAPENGQPFGRASKRMLSELVFGQTVAARVTDIDRYGRAVAVLTRARSNINAEMVKRGAAWAYRRYLSDQRYLLWESEARQKRRGLWRLQADQIIPPWEWRSARRGRASLAATNGATRTMRFSREPDAGAGTACGTKRLCRQMSSCAEAQYHLRSCGVSRLDGDGDGVPCEKLCR